MRCYLCETLELFFFRKNGYDLFRCPVCGLVQTDLRMPYKKFLRSFYQKGYFTGEIACGAYVDYAKDKPFIVRNMQSMLSEIPKNSGRLLDIGCAYGYLVELALALGFDAHGLDTSAYAIKKAPPRMQSRLRLGTIDRTSYPMRSFDVITMLDVVEHLADPIADLQKVRGLLKDDGIIMIATGDTDSLAAKILKHRWTFFIPPQHLFFFNKKTITETLNRAGFTPIQTFRIGKWLSLSYVLHLAKTSGQSKLAQYLIPIIRYLHLDHIPLYLPMGDNMVIIAKK